MGQGENMNRSSALNDRILWYDGTTTVLAEDIEQYIKFADGGSIYVDKLTEDLDQYNRFAGGSKIQLREDDNPISPNWNLPDHVLDIDLEDLLNQRLSEEIISKQFTDQEMNDRVDRLEMEYSKFEEFKLTPVLRAIFYIINMFEENDIVWGVGRGSSVSSYILYLMKIHDVDSVKFDLDFSEFMR